jgi:hypothetical protein
MYGYTKTEVLLGRNLSFLVIPERREETLPRKLLTTTLRSEPLISTNAPKTPVKPLPES